MSFYNVRPHSQMRLDTGPVRAEQPGSRPSQACTRCTDCRPAPLAVDQSTLQNHPAMLMPPSDTQEQ